MAPILISIEGNIGSGKTTLLRELRAAHPEWYFVDEPVDQWMALKNEQGESLLELFYKDKRRWGYTFQNTALLTRLANLQKVLEKAVTTEQYPVIVMERSVGTDAHVFAKMLWEEGDLDDLEFTLYKKWYEMILWDLPPMRGYIHIDTPVTMCSTRIQERARHGEELIPVEYLDKLDSAHFAWLRGAGQTVPVLRYDNCSVLPKDRTSMKVVEEWVRGL